MGDNIIISEDSKLAGNSSLFDKEMILFANNPQQFELGKKYNFSIKILNTKYAGGIINDAELIGYNLQIGKLEQNQNGNFILYVSNQSSAIDPVDIKIFIDGEVVVEQNFSQNGGHNWKKFQLSLSKGIHSIYAVSIKGEVKLEKEFEVKDKHWVAIDYGYFPLLKPCSSNYCGEFTPRQFNFDMRDEPIYFE
jgi:hypothetical protein